jgi:hypothetical protein
LSTSQYKKDAERTVSFKFRWIGMAVAAGLTVACGITVAISEKHNVAKWAAIQAEEETAKAELTQVTFPAGIKFIDIDAYMGTGLTSVTIPEGVTDIKAFAFRDCKNLTSVTLPRSLKRVGSSAFRGCTSLTDVIIPSGITINYGSYSHRENGGIEGIGYDNYFLADQDYVGTVSAGRKSHFKDCTSLSAASQQAIRNSGYIGEF